MQGLWYGDRRDRVKWGAIVYLAKQHRIRDIVQVAYFRHGPEPTLEVSGNTGVVDLPAEVWDHFSDLSHIRSLGSRLGLTIEVLGDEFKPKSRDAYVAGCVDRISQVRRRKVVFLDPDTGMAPSSSGPQHVTVRDAATFWEVLRKNDILAVYQHADRTTNWITPRAKALSDACSCERVSTVQGTGIAKDVALLWCRKP